MKNSWKVSEISAQRRTSLAVSDIPPVPGGRGTLGSWASELERLDLGLNGFDVILGCSLKLFRPPFPQNPLTWGWGYWVYSKHEQVYIESSSEDWFDFPSAFPSQFCAWDPGPAHASQELYHWSTPQPKPSFQNPCFHLLGCSVLPSGLHTWVVWGIFSFTLPLGLFSFPPPANAYMTVVLPSTPAFILSSVSQYFPSLSILLLTPLRRRLILVFFFFLMTSLISQLLCCSYFWNHHTEFVFNCYFLSTFFSVQEKAGFPVCSCFLGAGVTGLNPLGHSVPQSLFFTMY